MSGRHSTAASWAALAYFAVYGVINAAFVFIAWRRLAAFRRARAYTPLDETLFTVPPGYRPALPRLHGGFDITKPDTLVNRLVSYWEEATAWTRLILRF